MECPPFQVVSLYSEWADAKDKLSRGEPLAPSLKQFIFGLAVKATGPDPWNPASVGSFSLPDAASRGQCVFSACSQLWLADLQAPLDLHLPVSR